MRACAHFVCSDIFSSTYHRCAMAPGIAHVGLFHGDTPVRKVALLQARRGEGGPSGTSCCRVPSVSDSGSSSKHPRVHSVSESRTRGRGAGFKGARAHAHSHTLTLVHTHPGTVPRTLSRVCARAGTLPRVRAHGRTLPTFTPARACVLADAHTPCAHAQLRTCVCACRRTPPHIRTRAAALGTRARSPLPEPAPPRLRAATCAFGHGPSGALCPLSRGEGGGCTRRP